MENSLSHEKLLRLKVASEMVLGNQASVAFSRAFYLENLLIERILHEFKETFENCQTLLDRIKKFTEETLDDSTSSDLSPITESSIRCQCSEMLGSLEAVHQPTLESFQQKLIQAKARRQAKSCLLETLSARNSDIASQFNNLTLAELINNVHIPEFSCFINDSDFGVLEKLVEEWNQYCLGAKSDFTSFEQTVKRFEEDIEKNKKMREYTCDMILAQITQDKQLGGYGTDTLRKKGLLQKFSISTLLRRHSKSHQRSASVSFSKSKDESPTPSQLSIAAISGPENQTF